MDQDKEPSKLRNKRAINGFFKNAETTNELKLETFCGRRKRVSSITERRNKLS